MPPISHKRQISILKDREEFDLRLQAQTWEQSPSADALLRLQSLLVFQPSWSDRQVFNVAKATIK